MNTTNIGESAEDNGPPRVVSVFNGNDHLGDVNIGRTIRATRPDGVEIGVYPSVEEARAAVVRDAFARAEGQDMTLSLRVTDWRPLERNTLQGFATVHIREMRLTVADVAVHRHTNGKRWASLPSKPWASADGRLVIDPATSKPKYTPILRFDSKPIADAFSARVCAELDRFLGEPDSERPAPAPDARFVRHRVVGQGGQRVSVKPPRRSDRPAGGQDFNDDLDDVLPHGGEHARG